MKGGIEKSENFGLATARRLTLVIAAMIDRAQHTDIPIVRVTLQQFLDHKL
jgi:hypothetical protein